MVFDRLLLVNDRTMGFVRKPKIALVGSRGIPPRYGGAETFVYELSKRLRDFFDVYVTCETDHFGVDVFEGVKRVHIWARHTPTTTIPAIYDVIATLYLLKKVRDIDVIYYVAPDGAYASILAKLAKKRVIVNTDGIEWRRLLVRMRFTPWHLKPLYLLTSVLMFVAEFLACKVPDVTIADSIAIEKYLEQRWRPKRAEYIAYGVRKLPHVDEAKRIEILKKLGLERDRYYLTIGRIVAENNIHLEIEAFKEAKTDSKLVIVGPIDPRDPYVKYLFKLKGKDKRIVFTGGIYEPETIYTLRAECRAYIHPYTVGGTNPSLLEQLQFSKPIIAYDVPFHREILKNEAIYFKTKEELTKIIEDLEKQNTIRVYREIPHIFTWEWVADRYRKIFESLVLLRR
jgi:glycosyltransferase involved in cell wall biosynthesis